MSDGDKPNWRTLRIGALDRALALDPGAVDIRFERAGLYREQGQFEAAKQDYFAVLQRAPGHFGALNDFGTLVLRAGFSTAARSLFGEAVRLHPDNPKGHVNLANLLLALGELEEARRHFEAALRIDPEHPHAHRGLGNLLAEQGEEAQARRHRDHGFKDASLTALPYRGDRAPVTILLLVSAEGGNIPTRTLIDDTVFRTIVLVAEYHDSGVPLPAHDLVFNSIGDADLCREALQAACAVLARTDRPVINHPSAVLQTGRMDSLARLQGLPDVVVPRMALMPRALLAAGAGGAAGAALARAGFAFPLLIRSPGFHTGRHFVRVALPNELGDAVAALPGDALWIIEQLDARGDDGKFRKYRAMTVDGRLYPLHCAVSGDWKVHYFTADMAQSAEHRGEDAAFLARMGDVLGARAVAALARIAAALGLDYGGVDFAVGRSGEVLVFEANATMVVAPPTAEQKWAYRRAAVEAVLSAVRAMLLARADGEDAAGVAAGR